MFCPFKIVLRCREQLWFQLVVTARLGPSHGSQDIHLFEDALGLLSLCVRQGPITTSTDVVLSFARCSGLF